MYGLTAARSALRTIGRSYATVQNASKPYASLQFDVREVAEL